jgi:hypothetical protein
MRDSNAVSVSLSTKKGRKSISTNLSNLKWLSPLGVASPNIFTVNGLFPLPFDIVSAYIQLALELLHAFSRSAILLFEMSDLLLEEVHG